jgi:Ca2+-binding EF-hand superfamily protein
MEKKMRKKTFTLSLGAAAAALVASGIAIAQPGPPTGDMTRADVETRTAAAFARMDANDDGVLNEADREARQAAMFDRLDADGNGSISREEFAAAHDKMRSMRGDGRHGGEHRMGDRGPGGRHGGPGMMQHMAKMADTNGDGAISQAEFTAAALARFDKADANKDGTVTAAERQAAHQQMREAMQARKAS